MPTDSRTSAKQAARDADAGLTDLKRRVASARNVRETETRGPETPTAFIGGADFAIAIRLLVEFIANIAVGLLLGYGLDWWLGTSPWFLFFGALFGLAAGVRTLYRTSQAMEQESGEPSDMSVQPPRAPESKQAPTDGASD